MKIRDQLIVRIFEDHLIGDDSIIKNKDLIELSSMFSKLYLMGEFIKALPGSIMRNWRGLADEYKACKIKEYIHENLTDIQYSKVKLIEPAYTFYHKTKTDYKLSKGFIQWIESEYKKLRGESDGS